MVFCSMDSYYFLQATLKEDVRKWKINLDIFLHYEYENCMCKYISDVDKEQEGKNSFVFHVSWFYSNLRKMFVCLSVSTETAFDKR